MLMSGRISDIVIHPENQNIWYVTMGLEVCGKQRTRVPHGILF